MQKHRNETEIVLTGGHAATTAGAVISEIRAKKYDWGINWIGAKYAIEGKKVFTLEYELLPEMGVSFFPVATGRLQTRFTFWTIPSLLKIPVGFFQSFFLLTKIKPRLVLSFGGYSSFPVILAAKILRIPVIIHEQTSAAGRANQFAAGYADKIALSRESSKKYFPKEKTQVVGNPVSGQMFQVGKKTGFGNPPVIFVTGGSRGSQKINKTIALVLPKLLTSYKLIHQTGEPDFRKFKDLKEDLAPDLSARYEVVTRVSPQKMFSCFEKADLVVSRAGANTVSEVIAAKRPGILIPLPISYLDEQTKNAEFAKSLGFAEILPQNELTPERLLEAIESVFSKPHEIFTRINASESPDRQAGEKLVNLMTPYIIVK